MDSITISLADKQYPIQALTVGQLEDLHVGVVREKSAGIEQNTREFWKQNIDLLAIALSADHPEMTAEVIRKLRLGSIKKVKKAVDEVLVFAGLIEVDPPKSAASGEAPAGAE